MTFENWIRNWKNNREKETLKNQKEVRSKNKKPAKFSETDLLREVEGEKSKVNNCHK
jgi:hypothetical protein